MTQWSWYTFIVLLSLSFINNSYGCSVNNIHKVVPSKTIGNKTHPNLVIYGVTQDCQVFFVRPDQINDLKSLYIDPNITYCSPHLVNLSFRKVSTSINNEFYDLNLIFKRGHNYFCSSQIEFPEKRFMLTGNRLYVYSILYAINYATCGYMRDPRYIMEPDLAFMDSTFADVVHIVDPSSNGKTWSVQQFLFARNNNLVEIGSFNMSTLVHDESQQSVTAKNYLISLNQEKTMLYFAKKHSNHIGMTCPINMYYKPSKPVIHNLYPFSHESSHFHISSISAVDDIVLIGKKCQKAHQQYATRLYITKSSTNDSGTCLAELPFLADFGITTFDTKDLLAQANNLVYLNWKRVESEKNRVATSKTAAKNSVTKVHIETTTKLSVSTIKSSTSSNFESTTVSLIEKNKEQSDVGDGRLLESDEEFDGENEEKDDDANTDQDRLGLMTDITVKDSSVFDQVTSQNETSEKNCESTDIGCPATNETISENLAASGQITLVFIPVTLSIINVIWFYLFV